MVDFITKYWRTILVFISVVTFIISIIKLIANSYAINKIRGNHIEHLEDDIKKLEKEDEKQDKIFKEYRDNEKEFKKEIKKEIHNVFLAIKRIEKKQIKNSTIVDFLKEDNEKNKEK